MNVTNLFNRLENQNKICNETIIFCRDKCIELDRVDCDQTARSVQHHLDRQSQQKRNFKSSLEGETSLFVRFVSGPIRPLSYDDTAL